ncbi:MAG TPA: SIMPL domain-containing protein, partial [Nitrososphaeraceae archaeon]|nr:SIMPL domain-containing protein [Nitrososphaeraceae archaeon]
MKAAFIASFVTIIINFLVAIAISLPVFDERSANAQSTLQNAGNSSNSTLFVAGNAQAMIKPDKVTLSLSVETTNTTANAALNANSEAMNKTLDVLREAGVMENE